MREFDAGCQAQRLLGQRLNRYRQWKCRKGKRG